MYTYISCYKCCLTCGLYRRRWDQPSSWCSGEGDQWCQPVGRWSCTKLSGWGRCWRCLRAEVTHLQPTKLTHTRSRAIAPQSLFQTHKPYMRLLAATCVCKQCVLYIMWPLCGPTSSDWWCMWAEWYLHEQISNVNLLCAIIKPPALRKHAQIGSDYWNPLHACQKAGHLLAWQCMTRWRNTKNLTIAESESYVCFVCPNKSLHDAAQSSTTHVLEGGGREGCTLFADTVCVACIYKSAHAAADKTQQL